jgi:hypothetical protein
VHQRERKIPSDEEPREELVAAALTFREQRLSPLLASR